MSRLFLIAALIFTAACSASPEQQIADDYEAIRAECRRLHGVGTGVANDCYETGKQRYDDARMRRLTGGR